MLYSIIFHSTPAIPDLTYAAFKVITALQVELDYSVVYVLPSYYVNWVRVSMFENGVLFPLTENIQATTAHQYLKDNSGALLFDGNGEVLNPEFSDFDLARIKGTKKSIYLNEASPFNGSEGYCCDGAWYFDYAIGARYGLNTETANANPTFRIDSKAGVINFDSTMAGKSVILEYVSDGMEGGNDSLITVNKLFEEYVYAYIQYAILNSKLGVQEYIVARARKQKSALLRNANIRISTIHPRRLIRHVSGQSKGMT